MANKSKPGRPPHEDLLTPTEWKIAHAVQHGMTNREIAARRGVSLDAVKFHLSNVLGKLQLRNRRALRGWFQAPRDSALAHRRSSMSSNANLGRIGQIARTVRDILESERWYRDVLGLPHLYTFGTLAFFDCSGTRLMLSQNESISMEESILYLQVDDIELAHAALSQAGVDFISAPHMIHKHGDGTEEWMAFFKDLEGRPLAIMAQVALGS